MTSLMEMTEIRAGSRAVSEYIWDANNLPSYLPVSRVEILEQSDRDVKVRHDFTAAGRTMELVCVIRMTDPARKINFHTVEGVALEGTWSLQELKGGTQLRYLVSYQPPGGILGKIMDLFVFRKDMKRICAEAMQKLKSILEESAA